MHEDRERSVVVVSTRTPFEADAIAAALREAGVDATSIPAPQLPLGKQTDSRVMVVESQETRARRALEEIRSRATTIDWENVEELDGVALDDGARESRTESRLLGTTAILLVPIGFVVTSLGQSRGDAMIRTIGLALLASAMVIGGYLLFQDRSGPRTRS